MTDSGGFQAEITINTGCKQLEKEDSDANFSFDF